MTTVSTDIHTDNQLRGRQPRKAVHPGFVRILAPDDGAAIRHYLRAHFLNGGGPVESPKFRVYDDEQVTVH